MTRLELKSFFNNFKYQKHVFTIRFMTPSTAKITGKATLIDVNNGKNKIFTDSRIIGFDDFNEFELLHYMRNWLANLAIHENDEKIIYKGKKIFDPHKVWNHLW